MSRVPAMDWGWLATTPTGLAADPAQGRDQLRRPARPHLEQVAVVGDRSDGVADVVGAGGAGRQEVAQLGGRAGLRVGARPDRRLIVGVVGQVLEGGRHHLEGVLGSSARKAATPLERAWTVWPPELVRRPDATR